MAKTLKPFISGNLWSYVVNENGNAIRITLEGYGSSTPEEPLQKMIDGLTAENFESLWQKCEQKKDIQD